MISLNDIDLHDAVLKKIDINVSDGTVTLSIDYFESADSVRRTELLLLFSEVSAISNIVDVSMLKDNARSGNVGYWHLAGGEVPTYIYLVGGCISITAKSASVINLKK